VTKIRKYFLLLLLVLGCPVWAQRYTISPVNADQVLSADSLKACVEPFEKAIEVLKDEQTKVAVAEYLKNACFRFREADPSYKEKYEKYAAMVTASQQQ